MVIDEKMLEKYKKYLIEEEKSKNTVEKYMRDIKMFYQFSFGREITKELSIDYKKMLGDKYKATSANSMITALNSFFSFYQLYGLRIKLFKIQKKTFRERERELTKSEYIRLVRAAQSEKNERLSLLMQTICGMGIRVSEHKFITVETLKTGYVRIVNKGRERIVFMPNELRKYLKKYCLENGITKGPVFITRNGFPLNRSNIWTEMKSLCETAGVDSQKVFPHNLRHLFALTFYRIEKDLVRLADILGHSSVDRTRIYTYTSGEEYMKTLSRLGLIV